MDCVGCILYFWLLLSVQALHTDWTVYMWLPDTAGQDPYAVWTDSGSAFNNGDNKTVDDLLTTGSTGYRNTLMDDWTNTPPDLIRVTYRNAEGSPLYTTEFSVTGSNITNWFDASKVSTPAYTEDCVIHINFTSYTASFSFSDNSWNIYRYSAFSLTYPPGIVTYLIATGYPPNELPVQAVPSSDCQISYLTSNPLFVHAAITGIYRKFCSSICRERNYLYGAAHNTTCSCLTSLAAGSGLSLCNTPCEGKPSETCGGTDSSHPPDAIIFNYVYTTIDTTQFNTPLESQGTTTVTAALEIEATYTKYWYGFDVEVGAGDIPTTINMILFYKTVTCDDSTANNKTTSRSFDVTTTTPVYIDIGPILVRCMYVYLYDNNTQAPLTFAVDITPEAIQSGQFVTASILSIEAAWEIPDPVTPEDDTCACECWVYNMLYGDSPYDNLTYAEIEVALQNVTDKLEKELAVNKSSLSSTIRKKTSADDDRQSAAVVGYTLGVALLTLSLGGILLADLPKVLLGFNILKQSLISRFGSPPLQPPDVTMTTLTNNSAT